MKNFSLKTTLRGRPKWSTLLRSSAMLLLLVVVGSMLKGAAAQQNNLPCNTTTPAMWVNGGPEGFSGLTQSNSGSWATPGNILNTTPTQGASYTAAVSLGAPITIKVKDPNNIYTGGNIVGFRIRPTGAAVVGSTSIRTYLGGNTVETIPVSTALLSSGVTSDISVVTSSDYDEVELVYSVLGVSSGIIVYHASMSRFCAPTSPDPFGLPCNLATTVKFPEFPVQVSSVNTGSTLVGVVSNPENAVNTSSLAPATLSVIAIGSASLSIKDQVTNYPAGIFAGFEIANSTIVGLNLLGNVTISTFLNGAPQEVMRGSDGLLSAQLLGSSGRYKMGFVTTEPFDEVQIKVESLLNIDLGSTLVYSLVLQRFCAGPALECNTPTPLVNDGTYPVLISPSKTGVDALVCAACQILNRDYVLDADPTRFAEIILTAGVATEASIAVKSEITNYPAGTFAAFDIENPALVGANLAGGLRFTTYLDGVEQETFENGNFLAAASSLLAGTGRQRIGFIATLPFDEVQITVIQTGANLGTTRVFNFILQSFCEGTPPACNTPTILAAGAGNFPVIMNSERTGVNTVVCVGCSLNDTENIIDNDPSTAATLILAAGVGSSGSVAVKKALTPFSAGTFAGFEIGNASLLDVNFLSAITLYAYRNNVEVASATGLADGLLSINTALISSTGRQIVGFIPNVEYDEIQMVITNPVGIDVGTTLIYSAITEAFCTKAISCNETYYLNDSPTGFPVIVSGNNTGFAGVANLGTISNPQNVISANTTDFATIEITANVIGSASIGVRNVLNTYPQGTAAGFTIRNSGSIVEADLFNGITISTYLNGALQESATGSNLLNLEVLGIPIFGSGAGIYNVGFITTQEFDEVKISIGALVSVGLPQTTDVFGAYIDTRTSIGGGLNCNVATNPDFAVTLIDVPVEGNISTNDVIPAGSVYSGLTPDPSNPVGATITLNPDGTYSFITPTKGVYLYRMQVCTPAPNSECFSTTLQITVIDGTATDNPPVANPEFAIVKTGFSVIMRSLANDAPGNEGSTLNTASVTVPAPGQPGGPQNGTITIDASGNITYTPNIGFIGKDSLRYTVFDNNIPTPLSGSAWQYFSVVPVTQPNTTIGVDDYFAGFDQVTGNVLDNDVDPEGDAQLVATPQSLNTAAGTFDLVQEGGFVFRRATTFEGPVSFNYTIEDNGNPLASANATLHLLISSSQALAIILTDFDARLENNMVSIKWKSSNESDGIEYQIERSSNGTDYIKIGAVPTKGAASDYTATDKNPPAGLLHYRLKMTHVDGSFHYSNIKLVKNVAPVSIRLFPNPATAQTVYVSSTTYTGNVQVQFVDITGKVLLQTKLKLTAGNNEPVNIAGLKRQFVFVNIINDRGEQILHTKLYINN